MVGTYKCMAITEKGTQCSFIGGERIVIGAFRHAVCKKHAEMYFAGKKVVFATHIPAKYVPTGTAEQATLPGIGDDGPQQARRALDESLRIELFFVKGIGREGSIRRVKVIANVVLYPRDLFGESRQFSAVDMPIFLRFMPEEAGVGGMLIRQGQHKAAYNRVSSGWRKVDITGLDIRLVW